MSLSREKAESLGLQFSIEGEHFPSDPDIGIFTATLTADGHTFFFSGKSEDEILRAAEQKLREVGRFGEKEDLHFDVSPTRAQEPAREVPSSE